MTRYKFNPRNHICSLVWTVFLLITVTKETKPINGITCAALFGLPTIVAGINLREKAERNKRIQIIKMITEKQMLTASQTANILDIPVSEAQTLLSHRLLRPKRTEPVLDSIPLRLTATRGLSAAVTVGQLYRESRISVSNRSEDMAVVYIPLN